MQFLLGRNVGVCRSAFWCLHARDIQKRRGAHLMGECAATDTLHAVVANPRAVSAIYQTPYGYSVDPVSVGDAPVFALPPVYPEWLGGGVFQAAHPVRFPYVVGEMARGIATPEMVIAASQAGFLGFYGSAGLRPTDIDTGLQRIKAGLGAEAALFGANLIHTPQQPGYEDAVVDLFLSHGVGRVSASAYMKLSAPIVRYMASGLLRDAAGRVQRTTHVFAKVSRAEVARQFMAPPPAAMLRDMVASGAITAEQAELAAGLPVASDITAEADSGGHTDNRPALTVFSSILGARDEVCVEHGLAPDTIRVGLAGGIGTPQAASAAFHLGAAYVLTGSINQACVESGLSLAGREALARATPSDVMMAPAADMFEQGVKVQVLKRGSLFGPRAEKLYRLYREGASYESLQDKDRAWLEDILGQSFDEAWAATQAYLAGVAPKSAARGAADTKVRFALVCRRYLFMGAQWAREGDEAHRSDYQIWCGPAMGAFNDWVAGSVLEPLAARTIAQVGWNILEGAARHTRISQLRGLGITLPLSLQAYTPKLMAV